MKKIFYIVIIALTVSFASCQDMLNTDPTTYVSGSLVFETVENAEVAMDGIYRAMYASWASTNGTENAGYHSMVTMTNAMADDMVFHEDGSGWYTWDYNLNGRRILNASDRPFNVWNHFYKMIANSNYIISSETTMAGSAASIERVVGEALAIRAFSYFFLIQAYQQTYIGNESRPGIPVYTEPTTSTTEGKGRGTVQEVYTQINSDIDRAIQLLNGKGDNSEDKSHIDYYVANGVKARICMVQEMFSEAATAAREAMKRPSVAVLPVSNFRGINNLDVNNAMWGSYIIETQSQGFTSLFSHFDSEAEGMYAGNARKCISAWLYEELPESDERRSWWNGELASEASSGPNASYNQFKFRFANTTTRTGDYIYMRYEEMLLLLAEAECRKSSPDYAAARTALEELLKVRDADGYAARLGSRSNTNTYNKSAEAAPTTLLEEVLYQRRIELWCETTRLFDVQRLKLGFNRNYAGTNHTQLLANRITTPGSKDFVLMLPQSEIDGNAEINQEDQNPE